MIFLRSAMRFHKYFYKKRRKFHVNLECAHLLVEKSPKITMSSVGAGDKGKLLEQNIKLIFVKMSACDVFIVKYNQNKWNPVFVKQSDLFFICSEMKIISCNRMKHELHPTTELHYHLLSPKQKPY